MKTILTKNCSAFDYTVALIHYSQKEALNQNMALPVVGCDGTLSKFCEL